MPDWKTNAHRGQSDPDRPFAGVDRSDPPIYNRAAIRRYQKLAPVPGQFLVVDGYKVHLYCIGTGETSVVIEGGLGDTWIGWQLVQPELARVTRVCSYDRLGLGWSDPSTGSRDAQTIVYQLRQLLMQAGVSGQLVLIGQSAGGLFVRLYATKYSSTIAGLVWLTQHLRSRSTEYRTTTRRLSSVPCGTARRGIRGSKTWSTFLD